MPRVGPMEVGQMDRAITIQQLAESAGSTRFPVETWTTLTSALAHRDQSSGEEREAMGQVSARQSTRWEIQYRADMDPETVDVPKTRRIVAEGRVYDIVAASQIGRREAIELQTIGTTKTP